MKKVILLVVSILIIVAGVAGYEIIGRTTIDFIKSNESIFVITKNHTRQPISNFRYSTISIDGYKIDQEGNLKNTFSKELDDCDECEFVFLSSIENGYAIFQKTVLDKSMTYTTDSYYLLSVQTGKTIDISEIVNKYDIETISISLNSKNQVIVFDYGKLILEIYNIDKGKLSLKNKKSINNLNNQEFWKEARGIEKGKWHNSRYIFIENNKNSFYLFDLERDSLILSNQLEESSNSGTTSIFQLLNFNDSNFCYCEYYSDNYEDNTKLVLNKFNLENYNTIKTTYSYDEDIRWLSLYEEKYLALSSYYNLWITDLEKKSVFSTKENAKVSNIITIHENGSGNYYLITNDTKISLVDLKDGIVNPSATSYFDLDNNIYCEILEYQKENIILHNYYVIHEEQGEEPYIEYVFSIIK